ncbi:hypothetical protein [Cerasicoccus arenae]|uniref:DUF4303 domain-containing protein n=1 Tax=Cerasicoccus arenae TaxID=424488 RepID=A0A8J3DKP2_9BACT|nr:hypothetical protein [Cerasicoccus arenae]MBK1856840.1 hypothetical protein [Cerasicoccus arenae]GHC11193.1 hypothetical protein GCM10007047_30630 [Cerasicoccus arenae]
MKLSDIDWFRFQEITNAICHKCFCWIESEYSDRIICAFGVEGGIEEGLVYISANTETHRNRDNQKWMADWSLRCLDEAIPKNACVEMIREISDQIASIEYGENALEVYSDLKLRFRVAALQALRDAYEHVHQCSFSKNPNFDLIYMDEEGDYLIDGKEAIIKEISNLKRMIENKTR